MVLRNREAPGAARTADVDEFFVNLGKRGATVKARVTVIRRVAVASDPKTTKVPKFDCGDGMRRSVFLPLDSGQIQRLAEFFKGKGLIDVPGGTIEDAVPVLRELITVFNKREPKNLGAGAADTKQISLSPDPCSLPGHTWTGHGCIPSPGGPGGGGILALTIGEPPTTLFGKVYTESATFAYGYCLSVAFEGVI